jgi:hypothetical protein
VRVLRPTGGSDVVSFQHTTAYFVFTFSFTDVRGECENNGIWLCGNVTVHCGRSVTLY